MARMGYSQPMDVGEHQSVSVSSRKIDNGYIVSRTKSGPGGYSCTEEFSPVAPDLGVEAEAEGAAPDCRLHLVGTEQQREQRQRDSCSRCALPTDNQLAPVRRQSDPSPPMERI